MRRFIASLAGLAGAFILLVVSSASAATIARNQTWDMRGQYIIDFTCTTGCTGAPHYINITSDDLLTGVFSGSGYAVNTHDLTWDVTGQVTGDSFTMTIAYTGAQTGYFVYVTGNIAPNGSLSGTAYDSSGSRFSWTATGTATQTSYKNHGQLVSSYGDRSLAAASSLGMPVVSQQ